MSTPNKSVVMIRHAQSEWNRQNRFTGWANPQLTVLGESEAKRAAATLQRARYSFDTVLTSQLQRAQQTAQIILQQNKQTNIPMIADWRLNERHYGDLQGKDKTTMAQQVGEQQVWRWRRGFYDQPPVNTDQSTTDTAAIAPNGESLAQTKQRVLAYWHEQVIPMMQQNQKLLISSHGNTLRALIMGLSKMSIEAVEQFEIPTGEPIVYQFSSDNKPLDWFYLSAMTQTKSAA